MWLVNVKTYKLEFFHDASDVEYVTLSHRWRTGEVSYADVCNLKLKQLTKKAGWHKIEKCCELAELADIQYVWVDTCCIDKSSSAELQEAINSMWYWYATSARCLVYLDDVASSANHDPRFGHTRFFDLVRESEWFRRGWTLQELIAPRYLLFFDRNWSALGNHFSHAADLERITGIPQGILRITEPEELRDTLRALCIAEKMSWAALRSTTRREDMAYCLLGLFNINMPMLYGEGDKAFSRLVEEVVRKTADQSLLAWTGSATRSIRASGSASQYGCSPVLLGLRVPMLPMGPRDFGLLDSSARWDHVSLFPRHKFRIVEFGNVSIDVALITIEPYIYLAILDVQVIETLTEERSRVYAKHRETQMNASGGYCELEELSADRQNFRKIAMLVQRLDCEDRYRQRVFAERDPILLTLNLRCVPRNLEKFGKRRRILLSALSSTPARKTSADPSIFVRSESIPIKIDQDGLTAAHHGFSGSSTKEDPHADIYLDIKAFEYLEPRGNMLLASISIKPYRNVRRGFYFGKIDVYGVSLVDESEAWPFHRILLGFDFDLCPTCEFVFTGPFSLSSSQASLKNHLLIGTNKGDMVSIRKERILSKTCKLKRRDNGRGLYIWFPKVNVEGYLGIKLHCEQDDGQWICDINVSDQYDATFAQQSYLDDD